MNQAGDEPESPLPKGLTSYVRTRLQLVSIETQEALTHLKGKVGPLVLVMVCAFFGYSLLLLAVVSLLGKLLSSWGLWGWELSALILAGLHIGAIFLMKKKISAKPSSPLFEYSRAEIERDREWIQEHNPKNKNSPAN